MNLVHGNTAAQYFPSRHNFALFRLVAYFRLRHARPRRVDTIYFIDRHQSAFETNAVTIWVLLTVTCYVAAGMFAHWPVPLAIAAAFPIALVGTEVPMVISGLAIAPVWSALRGGRYSRISANSFVMMVLMFTASAWFTAQRSWVRLVAWQFLGLCALNAAASIAVLILRRQIAELEERAGGAISAE